MSTSVSSTKKEKAKFFEMVLCSPGMSEFCKINLKISRQNALLLSRIIEAGILGANADSKDEFLSALPEGTTAEFKMIHEEILKKAGLAEFYEKLKTL